MSAFATEETLVSLAAMILADGDAEVSAENINTLLKATGNEVAPYWPSLFASFLKNGKAEELILTGGALGGGGGGGGGGAAGGDAGDAAEAVEEAKPVEEEVDPMEGGMDMFGGGGGDY
jgi:ribosomal protein L12E/L44/L45/RPP1/RPP2